MSTSDKPRVFIDGLPVYCAHDDVVDVALLKPHPKNPNKHPPKQVAMLAKIIGAHGWRAPITVSRRSGFIVRGHGRLAAAKELKARQVPVDYQHYPNEAAEHADLVADNRIGELAEMDVSALYDLIKQVDVSGYDLELMGYDAAALDNLRTHYDVLIGGNSNIDSAFTANDFFEPRRADGSAENTAAATTPEAQGDGEPADDGEPVPPPEPFKCPHCGQVIDDDLLY